MHDASACLRFTIKFYRKADRRCGNMKSRCMWSFSLRHKHSHRVFQADKYLTSQALAVLMHMLESATCQGAYFDDSTTLTRKGRGFELCLEAWQTSTIPSSAHFRISESSYLWNLSQKFPKEAAVCSLRQINTTSTVSRYLFHPSDSNKASPGICFRSQSSRDKSVWLGCGSDSPLDFRDRRGGRIW